MGNLCKLGWCGYASTMKPTAAILFVLMLTMGGCGGPIRTDQAAADYLGAGPVHVLSAPTRIEGWNFQRANGSIATDPPIRPLDLSVARELGEILLSEGTYRSPTGAGGFVHDVGYRIWRGDESVDVLLSFGNQQMQLKYHTSAGPTSSLFASIGAAQDRLIHLSERAFPDYKPSK
jgi:hypothetical protein